MKEHIAAYIKEINRLYQTGLTTEHSFRPALKQLLEDCTGFTVINEQSHIDCGAPDMTLLKKDLPMAYVEAKDLEGGDLDGRKKNREQFDRYKTSLDTVLFTDYLDFHLYNAEDLVWQVTLATIQNGNITLNEDEIDRFISLMERLRAAKPQRITSARKLAKIMAYEARLMARAIGDDLKKNPDESSTLRMQYNAFKEVLLADLKEERFADLYAQTITYGLFSARLNDNTPRDFDRQEAANLVPRTNPFLRKIFQNLAGFDIEKSIEWIVNDLVSVFAAVDVAKLRKNFEKEFQQRDPMIHFYEDFLHQYDPATKKKYGVYYTPSPVVNFIVRAVDDILQKEFGLKDGLADTSKLEDGKTHRVQVLDPATGTGTFLAEVVNRIKEKQQKGLWPKYVDEHLLPRLYGFELMVAPYTIAHIKLDMLIKWWGEETLPIEYKDRIKVYLTNSLDQQKLETKNLFSDMIAREANEANDIKHNAPVMIVLGNPPYSVSSPNKSKWINDLLAAYKKNLNERNIQPLSDDYIKFIRLAQYYVEKNQEGIVAYITNSSFLDGLIHRQMRRELMRVFDKIYILDLHGNSRKNEVCPDGSKDENVFDIMQGVSINIFVKTGKNDTPVEIRHFDLYGTREHKYDFLKQNDLASIHWQILTPQEPQLFFVPKDFAIQQEYDKGFRIDGLVSSYISGVQSGRDDIYVDFDVDELSNRVETLLSGNLTSDFVKKYNVVDSSSYPLLKRMKASTFSKNYIVPYYYRLFDKRNLYYDKDLIKRSFFGVLRNTLVANNFSFLLSRQQSSFDFQHIIVSDCVSDMNALSMQTREGNYVFPLYLYPEEGSFDTERRPNLDETIWWTIENWVKYGQSHKPLTANEQQGLLGFDAEPEEPHTLSPEDIFDYIYGVLHSPAYRAKYKEFLKVDFPRIPYPKNADEFEHFRNYGHQLRELHLMHNVPPSPVQFNHTGSMFVEQVTYADGCVRINNEQFFENVPQSAWEFYIGGYQPAQKWLKDRKGRELSTEDVKHYEKIIAILIETDKLMKEIDK